MEYNKLKYSVTCNENCHFDEKLIKPRDLKENLENKKKIASEEYFRALKLHQDPRKNKKHENSREKLENIEKNSERLNKSQSGIAYSDHDKEFAFHEWLESKKKAEKLRKINKNIEKNESIQNPEEKDAHFREWIEKTEERKKKESELKKKEKIRKAKEEEEKMLIKENKKFLAKRELHERLAKIKPCSEQRDFIDRKIDSPLLLSYSTAKDLK